METPWRCRVAARPRARRGAPWKERRARRRSPLIKLRSRSVRMRAAVMLASARTGAPSAAVRADSRVIVPIVLLCFCAPTARAPRGRGARPRTSRPARGGPAGGHEERERDAAACARAYVVLRARRARRRDAVGRVDQQAAAGAARQPPSSNSRRPHAPASRSERQDDAVCAATSVPPTQFSGDW